MAAPKKGPQLLSGGNPQISKGEGNGPTRDYIAAMPGWKRDVGKRLDELVVAAVADVHKAVKGNQPFYGRKDDELDEAQLRSWIEQAADLPGERM